MSENNNNSTNPQKLKAIGLIFQTSQSDDKFKEKYHKKYFEQMNIKEGILEKRHFVSYGIINFMFEVQHLIDHLNKIEKEWVNSWIMEKAKQSNQIWYAWYLTHVHSLVQKIPYQGGNIQKKQTVDAITMNKIRQQNQSIINYEKIYEIIGWYVIVVDSRFIKLMIQRKKLFEYRSWTIHREIPVVAKHNIKRFVKERKINKPLPTPTVKKHGPLFTMNNVIRAPTRKVIKQRREKFDIMQNVINKKPWIGGYDIQQRFHFDANDMSPEFEWIITKSMQCKNENIHIQKHNDELITYMRSMVDSTKYWYDILNDRELCILLNFVDVMTTKPHHADKFIKWLSTECQKNPRLRAPIAYCLSIIRPGICSQCKILREFKYQYRNKQKNSRVVYIYIYIKKKKKN